MGETISQRELRNDSAHVLRRVEAGEILTVTRRGVPVADLVPHHEQHPARSRFVSAKHIVDGLRPLPPWGAEAFEAEQRELDNRLDDGWRDPWQET